MQPEPALRLITIPLSHYCERARWALEHCGVPFVEEQHLQVFSGRRTRALGARRFVPVLVGEGVLLKDSSDIVAWADAHAQPGRRLYPTDPALRDAVLAFEKPLAEVLGVEARKLAYDGLLPYPRLFLRYNGGRAPWHQRLAVRLAFPWMARKLRDYLRIHPADVEAARPRVEAAFDAVAAQLAGRDTLFGDAFTAADLTFASLASILLWPPEYGMPVPPIDELPEPVRAETARWRTHPAGRHALRVYAAHRR